MDQPADAPVGSERRTQRRTTKTSETIARQIVRDLILGKPEGTALLQEAQMIERYGVARSTIREALRILEIYGLITLRAGRGGGPSVRGAEPKDVAKTLSLYLQAKNLSVGDVLATRQLLESTIAGEVARAADSGLREEATALRARGAAVDTMSDADYNALTREFHDWLLANSPQAVTGLIALSLASMFRGRLDTKLLPSRERNQVLRQHDLVLEAIIEGDGGEAVKRMREHMDDYVRGIARRQPEAFRHVVPWE